MAQAAIRSLSHSPRQDFHHSVLRSEILRKKILFDEKPVKKKTQISVNCHRKPITHQKTIQSVNQCQMREHLLRSVRELCSSLEVAAIIFLYYFSDKSPWNIQKWQLFRQCFPSYANLYMADLRVKPVRTLRLVWNYERQNKKKWLSLGSVF